MTDNNHPITPPPELVEQWYKEWTARLAISKVIHVATQAARWGWEQRGAVNEAELQKARDEELEACCADLRMVLGPNQADWLHSVRRPKPPSLKEEALQAAQRFYANGHEDCNDEEIKDDFDTIRRALESLPE